MLIKCDTIKIRCNYKYLKEIKTPFNIQYNSKGNEQGKYFNSKHYPHIPYNLYIATNNYHQSLEIEFSSKILKEHYPELINKNNIRQCLENINKLDICTIDVDGILNHGWIIRADITKDVDLKLTEKVLDALNNNVGNYRRFKWQHYIRKGITFTKDTKYNKEEIKIYDKYQELQGHSRKFVDTLENRKDVMDYFYGKVRFEITLKGESQITEQLGVGTGIKEFFNAIDCVIRNQFNRVFNCSALELDTSSCSNYEEWAMAQILDKFNGDLKKIEQSLREKYDSRNGLANRMEKFKLVKSLTNKKENEIIKQVRNLL